MSVSLIPYQKLKAEHQLAQLPSKSIQRALLAATVACAILSLIPSISVIGSLSLRTIACVTAGVQCIDAWRKDEKTGLALQIVRLASVALGLAGVAMNMMHLVIGAIACNILFQASESALSLKEKKFDEVAIRSGLVLVDTFLMIGMATGAWPYIVTAAAISSVAMLGIGISVGIRAGMNNDKMGVFDATMLIALSAVGIASSVIAAEHHESRISKKYFFLNNDSEEKKIYHDLKGNVIAELEPGEKTTLTLERDQSVSGYHVTFVNREWEDVIVQEAMKPENFPTLPIGGSAVVLNDRNRLSVQSIEEVLEDYLQAPYPNWILENLDEKELIERFRTSTDEERSLIVKEVAFRLKEFRWRNTNLLLPFLQNPESELYPLVTLFDLN